MKFWTVGQALLREDPNATSRKLLDIPFGKLVTPTGEIHLNWIEVVYVSSHQRYCGWVYEGYLETYGEEFLPDVVAIQNATEDPNDAAQYMIWKGNKQFNLCGELCVCYLTGEGLEDMLTKWEAKAINIFQRVFRNSRSRGTDLWELDSMLSIYDYEVPSLRVDAALRDGMLNRAVVTPGRLAEALQLHRAIVGVKISSLTGNLENSGILHWVVVEHVMPDGINRGWVELYNPFPNRLQRYSWNEFVKSMGNPYGLLVKR